MKFLTYEDLFGPLNENYSISLENLANGRIKPNSVLWSHIFDTEQKSKYIYIGDKKTDLDFILSDASVNGVIIPSDVSRISSFITTISSKKADTRVSICRQNLKVLLALFDNLYGKEDPSDIFVGLDLDDTVHPKFDSAQKKAAYKFATELASDDKFVHAFNEVAIAYIQNYDQNFKKLGKGDKESVPGGSDFKVALSVLNIMEFYALQRKPPENQGALKYLKEVINQRYVYSEKGRIRLIEDLIGLSILPDKKIQNEYFLIPRFRELEAEFSKAEIEKGEVYFYKEIVKFIDAMRNKGYAPKFVTNKPESVLKHIYDSKFQVK